MISLASYPKVYNFGHRAIRDLLQGPVFIQEKIDGSQFSFGVIDGQLHVRTKGGPREVEELLGDQLFAGATRTALAAFEAGRLREGWIYRGESMRGPKHNVLNYTRTPVGNLVLFDVDVGLEDRLTPFALHAISEELGCEAAPLLSRDGEVIDSVEKLKALATRSSILGGDAEGIVVKNYNRFGIDGKMLMGKIVTADFREKHANDPNWKPSSKNDILEQIKNRYRHERRWEKAVERARDEGTLTSSPQDIGPLIKSIQADVIEEEGDEIAQMLLAYYRKQISGGVVAGFPEWYKERLLEAQFAAEAELGA